MLNESFIKIAEEASKLLNDSYDCDPEYNFTRWSQSDLVEYAKDALVMLTMLYPKKFTKVKTITLRKGKVQYLDDGCTLVKVIGDKDSGVSSSIASAANERLMELFPSGCREPLTPEDYEVESFSIEESSDSIFYVQPPAPVAGIEIEVIVSCPPDFNDKDYVIPTWAHNAVIEWMLYRAYSSEDESVQNINNADMHLKHFYTIVSNYMQAGEYLRQSNVKVPTGEVS